MYREAVCVVIVALCASFAAAQTVNEPSRGLENVEAPDVIADVIGDQRINVYITDSPSTWEDEPLNSTTVIGIAFNDTTVSDVRSSAVSNASYEFIIGRETVREAADSEQPRKALIQAYKEDKIRYRGLGTWNSLVASTTKTMTSTVRRAYDGVTTVTNWLS